MSESTNTLREVLSSVRKSVKNARGAIESNQVVDKDVHGTLTRVITTIDAALTFPPPHHISVATAADVNSAFDPANEAFGMAFRDGFKEGWVFAVDASGNDYQGACDAFKETVASDGMIMGEAFDAHRHVYFSMLPLAAIPELGVSLSPAPAEHVMGIDAAHSILSKYPKATVEAAITAYMGATAAPVEHVVVAEPKRWLAEWTLPGGSIRWHVFEHEHQARTFQSGQPENRRVTALYDHPAPAELLMGEPAGYGCFDRGVLFATFLAKSSAEEEARMHQGTEVHPIYRHPSPVEHVVGWEAEEKLTVEQAWTILCETPDITSPEEYPDHALITIEQLGSFMARAAAPASGRLIEAAKEVIASASDTYKKRNGHLGSFEDDSGEKCWIVPFDAFEALRSTVATVSSSEDAANA